MSANSVSTAKIVEKNYTDIKSEVDKNKVLYCKYDNGKEFHEVWKDIPDYKGKFQVSSFGRVKSLERMSERKKGNYLLPEKILTIHKTDTYWKITLSKDGKLKNTQVHQLMAMAFLDHQLCGHRVVVDHKDNDPDNNHIENLQLVTQRLNASKDKKDGTSRYVGVYWKKENSKWQASIYHKGQNIYLGLFDSEKEAHLAYQKALDESKVGDVQLSDTNKTSKYRGVYSSKNRWCSSINHNGEQVYLGMFSTEKEAYRYYVNAEQSIKQGKPIEVKRRKVHSIHKGVRYNRTRGTWMLYVDKKYIGVYKTEAEAIQAKKDYFKN